MRKIFTYLVMLVAFMFTGMQSGKAQFSGSANRYSTGGYELSPIAFNLTEVAAAVGTDTATLVGVLDAWKAEWGEEGKGMNNPPETNYVFLKDADGNNLTGWNQGDAGGYWMDNNGEIKPWNEGCTWYDIPDWSAEEDKFYFYVGQMPNTMQVGDVAKATFALVYNGKEATFEISINVVEKPTLDAMAEQLLPADYEVVAEKTIEVVQTKRATTAGDTYTLDLSDVIGLLGDVDMEALSVNIEKVMYTSLYDSEKDYKTDYISSAATENIGTVPGWWFQPLQDKDDAAYTGESVGATTGAFYADACALDAETKEFSIRVGQNATVAEGGDKYYAEIYMALNGKAIKIRLDVTIEKPVTKPLAEMTKVGEESIEAKHPYSSGAKGSFTLDLDKIAETLGVDKSEVLFKALSDETSIYEGVTTANRGGYWMTKEGYPIGWNVAGFAIYVEPDTENDFTNFGYGFEDPAWELGDKSTIKLLFVAGEKYYVVNLNVEIIEAEEVTPENMLTVERDVEIVPSPDTYPVEKTTSVDLASIEALIGTSTPTFYAYAAPAEDGGELTGLTKAYSCDPNPGFWMSADGTYRSTWAPTCAYGVTYANGVLTWYQYPGQRQVGETYTGHLFFVNESNNKMVTYICTVKYVEEYSNNENENTEIVGMESITLPVGEEQDYKDIDMTAACKALGITEEELETVELKAYTSRNTFTSSAYDEMAGFLFDAEGFWVNAENNDELVNGVYYIGFTTENGKPQFTTTGFEVLEDGVTYTSKLALDYEGKRYIFTITVGNENTVVGIDSVELNNAKSGNVYDVTGRLVRKNAKSVNGLSNGVYILNGKKYIVK